MSYPQGGDEALAFGRPACYLSLFSAVRTAENRDKAKEWRHDRADMARVGGSGTG
jgi:hypothetical protein